MRENVDHQFIRMGRKEDIGPNIIIQIVDKVNLIRNISK